MEMMEININGTENGTDYWLTTEYPEPYDNPTDEKDMFLVKLLIVLIVIAACITTLVYFAIRKRRMDQLRHRLMPFYKFEPGEEDEWQTELLEESEIQPFSRLQVNTIQSTSFTEVPLTYV